MRPLPAVTPFQVLWTLNIGFDAAYYLSGPTDLPHLATLLACGIALARPHRMTLGAAWLMSIALWWLMSPMTTNHGFTTMVGSGLALALGAHHLGPRRSDRFVPTMMWFIAAVYGAAILQKLNTAYLFDTQASCAVALMDQWWPIPGWLAPWLPPLSLIVEGGLAVGMLIPQTRAITALAGTLFHFVLGLSPLSPILLFSLTMVALYSAAWRAGPDLLLPVARITLIGAAIGRLLSLAGWEAPGGLTLWICWLTTVPITALLFIKHSPSPLSPWPQRWSVPLVAAMILPWLNTIPAHTGDRQFNSYDMYSNLQVDEAGSNHLFLPSLAQAHSLRARVRVIDSEPAPTNPPPEGKEDQVARVELVRSLQSDLYERITWIDGEDRYEWARGQPIPYPEISAWHLKTRRLRALPGEPRCVDCPACEILRDLLHGPSP